MEQTYKIICNYYEASRQEILIYILVYLHSANSQQMSIDIFYETHMI